MENLKILIADDNKANQLIAGKFLNQLGIETEFARNGEEAIDLVSKKNLQLVLMDINMPVLNGFDACKQIRNKDEDYFKRLPIIAVTSSFAEDIKQQMSEFGMTDYIPKPINPKSIKKIIGKYLPDLLSMSSKNTEKIQLLCECDEYKFDCSRLFEITNGNIEMVRDIVKTIIEILPAEISVIGEAIKVKDYTLVKRSAHKIKPNYEYVGLLELASMAERIEESAGKIKSGTINELIDILSTQTLKMIPSLSNCELRQVR